jgi:serine/threonine protein kinase
MPMSFSLTYAPPEVIAAYDAGEKNMPVSGAGDMWSLGVIAYELLTGRRAFPKELHLDDVRAQVMGAKPLPWEKEDLSKRKVPSPHASETPSAELCALVKPHPPNNHNLVDLHLCRSRLDDLSEACVGNEILFKTFLCPKILLQ